MKRLACTMLEALHQYVGFLQTLTTLTKRIQSQGNCGANMFFKVQALDKLVYNNYAICTIFEVHPDTVWVEKTSKLLFWLLHKEQSVICLSGFGQQVKNMMSKVLLMFHV